jgi:hypothetical protein
MDAPDIIVRPVHYAQYSIEPIEFIMHNDLPFYKGNVVKYVARAGYKLYPNMNAEQSEVTDLKKAIRYCQMRINQIEGKDRL